MDPIISLNLIDYLILAAYVAITIVVGYALKKYMKTSEDFSSPDDHYLAG